MEQRNQSPYTDRLPNEVVETYRRSDTRRLPGERVSVYRRPLPGREPGPVPSSDQAQKKQRRMKMRRRRKGVLIFLSCLAIVSVLAAVSVLLESRWEEYRDDPFEQYFDEEPVREASEEVTIPTWPTGQGAVLSVLAEHGEELTPQEIYRQVNPAVVMVLAELAEGTSVGTGVIFTSDGYILTNYHVLEGGRDCMVVLSTGAQYAAKYVAGDQANDLAVLKVDGAGLPTATFGESDLLEVGNPVYAIGNPLGVELQGTLTDGIVSAIDRDVVVDEYTMTLIQTNAALNSGNSGGPLINRYGQVVGINVIKMTSDYSNVEGLGFAIPSASIERIANDLLTYGAYQPEPVLGVTVWQEGVQLTEDLWGLEVQEVTPGSAADRAGILPGDYILSANGQELRRSRDLLRVRRHTYVGDQMTMTLWRDGEQMEVILDLQESIAD